MPAGGRILDPRDPIACRGLLRPALRRLRTQDRNNQNVSEFCSRQVERRIQEVERRIQEALSLQATDPKTGAAWAAVDRQVVDQAPAIGLLVPQEVNLVAKRVGNYQHNPVGGTILSQLWVA
jgi:hypothetical protein